MRSSRNSIKSRDEVAVFTFDSSLHDRRDFTRDLASLRDALSEFEPFGTTSLYDATAATARQLAARSGTHKAIIVLTDGIDNSSEHDGARRVGPGQLNRRAGLRRRDRAVVGRAVHAGGHERLTPSDSADLRDLAEWTGGQLVFATTLVETVVASTHLIDGLRQQYVHRHRSGERPRVATARRQGQTSVDGRQSAERILRRLSPRTFRVFELPWRVRATSAAPGDECRTRSHPRTPQSGSRLEVRPSAAASGAATGATPDRDPFALAPRRHRYRRERSPAPLSRPGRGLVIAAYLLNRRI